MICIKFIAVDQATKSTGYSIFEDDKLIKYGLIDLSDIEDTIERVDEMVKLIVKIIYEFKIDKVYMEEIQLQMGNVRAFKTLAYLQGLMVNFLYNQNIPYKIVPSSTWKSKCNIKGRKRVEQKENAMKFVKEKYGIEVSTDIADSICIGTSQLIK